MGLISVDDLNGKLEGLIMNPADNFLSGQVTSPFKKVGSIVGGAASAGVGVAGMIDNADSIIKQVGEEITAIALERVNEVVQKIVQDLTKQAMQMPKSIPTKIKDHALKKFNEEKKSLAEIMASAIEDAEIERKIEVNKVAAEAENKQKKSITQKIQEAQQAVNDALKRVDQKVKMVCVYVDAGPDWVVSKVNTVLDDCVAEAENAANSGLNQARKQIDEFCKGQGEEMGQIMADEYNETLKNVIKNQLTKIETSKRKAKTKANTAIQKGLLKIMSMTGVSIQFTPSA